MFQVLFLFHNFFQYQTLGHLICTLISENQGLEKLRSVLNLREISGLAHLEFFSVCHLDFFQIYSKVEIVLEQR